MSKPIALPPACPKCAPHGGYWIKLKDGRIRRCECPRGRILARPLVEEAHAKGKP
jgi:hypothetical protein